MVASLDPSLLKMLAKIRADARIFSYEAVRRIHAWPLHPDIERQQKLRLTAARRAMNRL